MALVIRDLRGDMLEAVPEDQIQDAEILEPIPETDRFGALRELWINFVGATPLAIASGDEFRGVIKVPHDEIWQILSMRLAATFSASTGVTGISLHNQLFSTTWSYDAKNWTDSSKGIRGSLSGQWNYVVEGLSGTGSSFDKWFTKTANYLRTVFYSREVLMYNFAVDTNVNITQALARLQVIRYPSQKALAEMLRTGKDRYSRFDNRDTMCLHTKAAEIQAPFVDVLPRAT